MNNFVNDGKNNKAAGAGGDTLAPTNWELGSFMYQIFGTEQVTRTAWCDDVYAKDEYALQRLHALGKMSPTYTPGDPLDYSVLFSMAEIIKAEIGTNQPELALFDAQAGIFSNGVFTEWPS